MDFVDEHTAWAKKRQAVNTKIHKRASILTTDAMGNKIEVGYKSEIIGVTLKNDANKARGKRGKLILFEEAGSFKDILQAWQIARPSVEEDGIAFGLMIAFGTGGDEASRFDGLKELFYNPSGYNVKAFPNIWDDGASGNTCAFFVPVYANMSVLSPDGKRLFMDKYGNTIRDKAIDYSLEQRQRVIDGSSDSRAIDRYIAENPITPQEAVLELTGNIFPKKELMIQLASLRTNKKLQNFKQVGDLNFINGELMWTPKKNGDITKYPLGKDDAHTGSIVIWEHPVKDAPHALYIAGCLTPGEKVLTEEGLMNVEDVSRSRLVDIDGNYVNPKALLRYEKEDEDIYKIRVSNTYRATTFTKEHPIYSSKHILNKQNMVDESLFNFEFNKASSINVGDWVKYPNLYYNGDDKANSDDVNNLRWLTGLWLGDGWTKGNRIYIAFDIANVAQIDRLKDYVINGLKSTFSQRIRNNSIEFSFYQKTVAFYFNYFYGKYAHGKKITELSKRSFNNEEKANLIAGYLDSDGCVCIDKRGYYSMEFVSCNLDLIESFHDLAFSIGLVGNVSKLRSAGKYNIDGRSGDQKEAYHLRFGHNDTIKFAEMLNFDSRTKLSVIDRTNIKTTRNRPKSGCFLSSDMKYIYFQIKDIDHSKYTGTVYNFETDTHTFCSYHVPTHNCDPYDHDKAGTNSLGSTFIYKRFQNFESYYDMLVAEYTGRPDTAEDYYENVRKLLMYYNARLLYENERKGIFPYFTQKHCDYLLADQPDIINDIIGKSTVQRRKGIHMNVQIKDYGEGLIKEWLNEEFAPGKKNLTKIMSEALLEELIQYNTKGNFDRVIALIMVMIYRLQMHNTYVKKRDSESKKINLFDKPLFSKEWYSGTELSDLSDIDLNTNTKEIKWF